MPSHRLAAFAALASFASITYAQYKGVLPPPDEYKAGFEAISLGSARTHLNYLAGPECQGRGSGQPGYQKAAEYVAARFKELGLVPIGDGGSYFQGVPFTSTSVDPTETSLVGPGVELRIGRGLGVPQAVAGSVESAAVVFLSLKPGKALPQGLELAGKAVVVNSTSFDQQARFALSRLNPAAILVVVDKTAVPMPSIGRGAGGGGNRGNRGARAISVEIERRYAIDMARALGADVTMMTPGHDDGDGVAVHEASGKVSLTVTARTEEIRVPNVVGMIPGSDPTLKAQYIGVGAHLDHEGVRNGVVYPGADDDASGSTAMLLVAEAVAANPVKPKRSIVFMAFCAEEMGLIGSRYYTDNPIMPLENMVCLLQMDMVGRNEESPTDKPGDNVNTIHLVGSKRISNELHNITLDMNKHIGFEFEYDEEDVYTRSDHYNFAAKGVPITFLFSGFHPDYHQPTDTPDKINFEKIVSAARLNYLVLQRVAALPHMVKRDAVGN